MSVLYLMQAAAEKAKENQSEKKANYHCIYS